MIKVTQRNLIMSVADRWHAQYPMTKDADKISIGLKLRELDKRSATIYDVDNIIGNSSWCRIKCDECGESVTEAVRVGEEPGYESSTAYICPVCLVKALHLTAEEEAERGGKWYGK